MQPETFKLKTMVVAPLRVTLFFFFIGQILLLPLFLGSCIWQSNKKIHGLFGVPNYQCFGFQKGTFKWCCRQGRQNFTIMDFCTNFTLKERMSQYMRCAITPTNPVWITLPTQIDKELKSCRHGRHKTFTYVDAGRSDQVFACFNIGARTPSA